MQNEFTNRLGMGRTVLTTIELAAYAAIWQGQPPVIFTTKAALLPPLLVRLGDLVRDQEAIITGFAELKDGEEMELEDLAQEIGSALATYQTDRNRADLAAEVDFSVSAWRRLTDESLLGRARLVHERLVAALAADAAGLLPYDLAAAAATGLKKEIDDYAAVISSPQAAIATRKSLTKVLRPHFRELSQLLGSMDKIVLRFRKTPEGRRFVDAWFAARVVRDLGGNSGSADPTPPANPGL